MFDCSSIVRTGACTAGPSGDSARRPRLSESAARASRRTRAALRRRRRRTGWRASGRARRASCSTSVRPRRLRDQLLDAGDRARRERGEPLGEDQRIGERAARQADHRHQAVLVQRRRRHRLGEPEHLLDQRRRQRLAQPRRWRRRRARGRACRATSTKRASSAATIRSQASASEKPAPAAAPSTAAIDRLRIARHRLDPVMQVIEHAPLRRLAGGAPLDQALHVAAGAEVAAVALQRRRSGSRGWPRRRRAPRCRRRSPAPTACCATPGR